jgi:hypothetical protein
MIIQNFLHCKSSWKKLLLELSKLVEANIIVPLLLQTKQLFYLLYDGDDDDDDNDDGNDNDDDNDIL